MPAFSEDLANWQAKADMTISDLAVWFGRPRSTVKTWVLDGRTPLGPSGRLARVRLNLLIWAVRQKRGLPVPATLSAHERPEYVRGKRDVAERDWRVSSVRAAG